MKTTISQMNDVTLVSLAGEIDGVGMETARMALVECVNTRQVNVVVNMSEVTFVSFMGVGMLVERLRQFRAMGGDMKLAGVNLYTQRLFRMVGCKSVFDCFESEAQAVLAYREAA